AVVQADPRDVALLGGAHERGGRRTERAPLREADEPDELFVEVERRRIVCRALGRQQMAHQTQAELPRRLPDRLLDEAVDDVVLAARQALAARLAVGDRRAGQALQL